MDENGEEGPKKGASKRLLDEEVPGNGQDQNKRSRGPLDCLNWDDSDEEEFTPFTQANPSPVSSPVAPIVVAKKSSGKGNVAKNKKSGNGVSSSRKGKSLGELMFCYKHFALEKRMWSVGRSVCETHTPSNIKHIPFILHSQWKKG